MIGVRFIGAVLVLALATTVLAVLEPAPTTLRYVIAFFRHGIRSPVVPSALPNDPNKEHYEELSGGTNGSLTFIGKQQMYSVGNNLKERYGPFISGYREDKVTVTSTKIDRTVMSAMTVMAAIFPPFPRIISGLPWQPVLVWSDHYYDFQKDYVYNDKTSYCPKYREWSSVPLTEFYSPDTRVTNRRIYDLVQQYAGDPNINTPSHLYNIYDTMYCARRNHLQLPDWLTTPREDFEFRPLFPDMLSPFEEELFESRMFYRENEDMLRIFTGPLFNIINSKFSKVSGTSTLAERLWYHSTHDTTLWALLRGLKVIDPKRAEPGDGLLFELHQDNDREYVKIHFYSANHKRITELRSPLCPSPCTLDMFSSTLKGLTPEQWDKLCENE